MFSIIQITDEKKHAQLCPSVCGHNVTQINLQKKKKKTDLN